jgi:hypothetical protein
VQENVDIYNNSPIRLHGIVINYLIIGTAFPGVKGTRPVADNTPNYTGVKKTWINISTPTYAFMA